MAAVAAIPPIDVAAPPVVAGREAGLSGKPLLAPIRRRLGAGGDGDRRVFDRRCRASPLSLVFCVFWPVVGLLATARSLRKLPRGYPNFWSKPIQAINLVHPFATRLRDLLLANAYDGHMCRERML